MRRLVATIIVAQASCAEPSVEYPGPPELTLGVGEAALTPIQDGDAVPITKGPQGGTIVWGAVSARYLDPEQLELLFSIAPPDGTPSFRRVIVDLDDADGGFGVGLSLGHPVFLPDVDQFSGLPCVWRLEATDREGRTAVDTKTVVPTQ